MPWCHAAVPGATSTPVVFLYVAVLQTAAGAMFGTFNVRADRLTVLKTSFPEELILTGRAPEGAPKVISMVAFR
jgi:hypothetical protein